MQEAGSTEDVPACFSFGIVFFINAAIWRKYIYGILQSGYYRSPDSRCCHRRGPWCLGRCEPHGRVRKRQPRCKESGDEAANGWRWCRPDRHYPDPPAERSVRLKTAGGICRPYILLQLTVANGFCTCGANFQAIRSIKKEMFL